jgi:hypothetical protein
LVAEFSYDHVAGDWSTVLLTALILSNVINYLLIISNEELIDCKKIRRKKRLVGGWVGGWGGGNRIDTIVSNPVYARYSRLISLFFGHRTINNKMIVNKLGINIRWAGERV